MKVVFALFIAFVSANIPQAAFEAVESELIDLFSLWKDHHGKTYATHEEHQMRFSIFKSNVDSVNTFNREKAPVVGWTKAVNKFADLTAEEFKAKFNGYKRNKASRQLNASNIYQATNVGLPTSVDWRTKGAVTPVKNQEDCGSCWSFSATGAMETLHFLKTGNLVALSEQNLVDCSTSQGNKGCDGGDMGYAFKYVIANGGIDTEESYPYEAQGPTTCRFDEGTVGSTLSAYKSIAQGSESALQSALAGIGSVSVAIDASEMQFYSSGIYAPSSCSSTDLDHGVLAVGYDNTNPSAAFYWVKNSWGPDWGLDGYVKMAMNKDNMCGIATDASIPTAL